MATECRVDLCENKPFGNFNKCALHCEKSSYSTDFWNNGLLSEFYRLLEKYILSFLLEYELDIDAQLEQFILDEISKSQGYNRLYKNEYFIKIASQVEITFRCIAFPFRDSRDKFDYFKILKLFKGIHFHTCTFYPYSIYLDEVQVFYEDCKFKNSYDVSSTLLLDNCTNSIYSSCTFEESVSVQSSEKSRIINIKLFDDCIFKKNIKIRNVILESEVFKFKDSFEFDMSDAENITCFNAFEIENCIFKQDIKLNYLDIKSLVVKNTKFEYKLEIQNTSINKLIFNDSNVSRVFDAFGSKFEEAYFYKSIFHDFAGFEKVEFGIDGNLDYEYVAKFIYTTFQDFSNFRNTNFHSGLDFENVNLKEQPNFLNAIVNQENTNRESFRIIKNSFDSVGNKIEANRFFVQEMKAYKQEIKDSNEALKVILNIENYTKEFIKSLDEKSEEMEHIACRIQDDFNRNENNLIYKKIIFTFHQKNRSLFNLELNKNKLGFKQITKKELISDINTLIQKKNEIHKISFMNKVIYDLNNAISDFGNSYVKPIVMLFLVLFINTAIGLDSKKALLIITYLLYVPLYVFINKKVYILLIKYKPLLIEKYIKYTPSKIQNFLKYIYLVINKCKKDPTKKVKYEDGYEALIILLMFYLWYFSTIYWCEIINFVTSFSGLFYYLEFSIYYLNLMTENLVILKIFDGEKTIFDLLIFIICSVLIWQIVVAIKRRVQR